ncbi:MAG: arsenic efflux protein, partial [Eubacterium sp.]|nr:arsenic efflux protein [Eubacterium sp.]
MILDVLLDAVIDTLKPLPFLFLTYLLMEYLESRTADKSADALGRMGKIGPLFGGAVGVVPQCGFSAAAASLYSGGVITIGTLLAVFLSTSDE